MLVVDCVRQGRHNFSFRNNSRTNDRQTVHPICCTIKITLNRIRAKRKIEIKNEGWALRSDLLFPIIIKANYECR